MAQYPSLYPDDNILYDDNPSPRCSPFKPTIDTFLKEVCAYLHPTEQQQPAPAERTCEHAQTCDSPTVIVQPVPLLMPMLTPATTIINNVIPHSDTIHRRKSKDRDSEKEPENDQNQEFSILTKLGLGLVAVGFAGYGTYQYASDSVDLEARQELHDKCKIFREYLDRLLHDNPTLRNHDHVVQLFSILDNLKQIQKLESKYKNRCIYSVWTTLASSCGLFAGGLLRGPGFYSLNFGSGTLGTGVVGGILSYIYHKTYYSRKYQGSNERKLQTVHETCLKLQNVQRPSLYPTAPSTDDLV